MTEPNQKPKKTDSDLVRQQVAKLSPSVLVQLAMLIGLIGGGLTWLSQYFFFSRSEGTVLVHQMTEISKLIDKIADAAVARDHVLTRLTVLLDRVDDEQTRRMPIVDGYLEQTKINMHNVERIATAVGELQKEAQRSRDFRVRHEKRQEEGANAQPKSKKDSATIAGPGE